MASAMNIFSQHTQYTWHLSYAGTCTFENNNNSNIQACH